MVTEKELKKKIQYFEKEDLLKQREEGTGKSVYATQVGQMVWHIMYECNILPEDLRTYYEYTYENCRGQDLEELQNKVIINGWDLTHYECWYDREYCLAAVKQNGLTLQYVKSQDKEICIEAVKEDADSLRHVKDQDREICLAAVKKEGLALLYVEEQDKEICLTAVKQNGYSLQFVKSQDKEICIEAVKENGLALKYVKHQDREICLEAVKQDEDTLQYVDKRVL